METHSQFPSEIYEAILDNLHDDKASLVNCALISWQFTYRSQRLLFKRVVLDSPFQRNDDMSSVFNPADKFLDAITHSPRLCRLVIELQISDQRESADPEWTYREANSWIRQNLAIAKILPLLSELENFSIMGHGHLGRLDFNCWTEDLRSEILSKIPTLRTLTLSWIRNLPFLILRDIPHLEAIHFSDVSFNTDDTFPPPVEPPNTTKLAKFYFNSQAFGDWPTLYPWLQSEGCTVDLKKLTHLSMLIDSPIQSTAEEVHSMSQVLRGCVNTLKYLRICFSSSILTSPFYNESFLDLGAYPFLETLIISGFIWSKWDRNRPNHRANRLQLLTNHLSQIASNKPLKNITLTLDIDDFAELSQSGFEDAGWNDFSTVVDTLAKAMQNVSVTLWISFPVSNYVQNVLQEHLKPLCERSIVYIRH